MTKGVPGAALPRTGRRLWAVLGLAAAATVAAVVIGAQPVQSPWWTYADADATYTASALDLLLGEPVNYLDHPGLPVTESATLLFGIDALVEKRSLARSARYAYADERLLDLDRTRPVFRGLAIAFYTVGVLLSFLLVARLFGHWGWGLAGALLWVAAPGLIGMSIQLRPDTLLAVLCLVFGYLVARGVDTRATAQYAGAAFVAGFALMVKVHAVGLLVPLALALAWRRPSDRWRPRQDVLFSVGLLLAVPACLFNLARAPFHLTERQWQALALLVAVGVVVLVLAHVSAIGVVAAAFAAGVCVPIVLDVPDGLQALVRIAEAAAGGGVQEGVDPYSTSLLDLDDIVGRGTVAFMLLAAVAGAAGLVLREPRPVVWSSGALVLGVLVYARPPNVHYFAPTFVLSMLCVLWLFHRSGHTGHVLVWPVVLLLSWPAFRDRDAGSVEARRFAGVVAASKAVVDARLQPGEFAYVPSYWPFPDSRYFELVQLYASHAPSYTYRYLPTTARAREFAETNGLRPRYYVGPLAVGVSGDAKVALGDAGTYAVRRLSDADILLRILGPG